MGTRRKRTLYRIKGIEKTRLLTEWSLGELPQDDWIWIEELRDLEPTRQTPEQQRRYLLGIATRFQELTNFAVEAQYERSPISEGR